MTLPADFEPAPRDPGKLRRTAWILVGIMLVGGFLILRAYEKMSREQAADTRPAKIHQIRKERDLRVIRQDAKTADLFDLRGKVFAVNVVSLTNPDVGRRSREVMKRLAAKYQSTVDFHLVSLVVDPPPTAETSASLAKAAAESGMTLPQWWLGTNDAPTLHKFIKQELKANLFPHQEDGVWTFDTSIMLIDREGHLRRAVVPQQRGGQPYVATFDFDEAASWDARGVKVKPDTELTNEAQLAQLLETTIDTLLAERPSPR
jgi:cytochrome oxidase Cu insertion factor (SCO1/SenC/PrrC family)